GRAASGLAGLMREKPGTICFMWYRSAHRPGDLAVVVSLCLAGCSGPQSALDPAGEEAARISTLFLVMVVGSAIIWLSVVALLIHASRARRPPRSARLSGQLILWGGAILPSAVLALLLGYALWLTPGIRPWSAFADTPRLRIEVVGEQFWWRVAYFPGDAGGAVISANEIRLPVGERVEF